jgi:monothiol glutaredoxin
LDSTTFSNRIILDLRGKSMSLTPETREKIDQLVNSSKIFVFMKGSKLMPQCGFSNNVVQILNSIGVDYTTFDVLEDYEVRQGIKDYSNWPTIPQVYVNGEFIGGSDIMIELYNSKELHEMLEVALAS